MDQLSRKRIIWAAMLNTTLVFILIAYLLVKPLNSNYTLTANPMITYILFGIGFTLLIISHFLPKIAQTQKSETTKSIDPIFIISLAINEMGSIVAFFIKMFFNHNEASLALFAATIIAFLAKFPRNSENS